MNWTQLKDPVAQTCLAGAVVASLLHKRWPGGRFEPFCRSDKYFVTEFSEFIENIQRKHKHHLLIIFGESKGGTRDATMVNFFFQFHVPFGEKWIT